MRLEWNLYYFRWVIDDGEPERRVGDVFEWFALSFWPNGVLSQSSENSKAAIAIADNAYRVNAEVIYISQDPSQAACIVDFGLKAISDTDVLPPGSRVGDFVAGEVRLELPLCTKLSPHNLTHRWRVNRISADLTPYVAHPDRGYFIRDSSQVRYQDVVGTDSVHAESYVLHCYYLTE